MVNYLTIAVGENICPVCGYAMSYPPRDFHICPSCGTEFGYHDAGRTYDELRRLWLETGPRWWSRSRPTPAHWDPWRQLREAGHIGVFNVSPTMTVASSESAVTVL